MKIKFEELCDKLMKKHKEIGMFMFLLIMMSKYNYKDKIEKEVDLDKLEEQMPRHN